MDTRFPGMAWRERATVLCARDSAGDGGLVDEHILASIAAGLGRSEPCHHGNRLPSRVEEVPGADSGDSWDRGCVGKIRLYGPKDGGVDSRRAAESVRGSAARAHVYPHQSAER